MGVGTVENVVSSKRVSVDIDNEYADDCVKESSSIQLVAPRAMASVGRNILQNIFLIIYNNAFLAKILSIACTEVIVVKEVITPFGR